jgi:hypothetical protein
MSSVDDLAIEQAASLTGEDRDLLLAEVTGLAQQLEHQGGSHVCLSVIGRVSLGECTISEVAADTQIPLGEVEQIAHMWLRLGVIAPKVLDATGPIENSPFLGADVSLHLTGFYERADGSLAAPFAQWFS